MFHMASLSHNKLTIYTTNYLSYITNIMALPDLLMQEARASADPVLTYLLVGIISPKYSRHSENINDSIAAADALVP